MLTIPFRGRYIQASLEGSIMLSIRAIYQGDDGGHVIRYFKPGQKIPEKYLLDIQEYIHVGNGQFWVSRLTGRFSSRKARELPSAWVLGRIERAQNQLVNCFISPGMVYATFPRNAYGANFRVFGVRLNNVYCVPAETHLEAYHFMGLMRSQEMEPIDVCTWNGKLWVPFAWKEPIE